MADAFSITATRTGRLDAVVAQMRDIPARVIPFAASTALTRTARDGQRAIVAEMPRVFDRPTRYTLNATRLVPASVDNLVATVAVKDQGTGGTRPESYLLPEVEGGPRREKRFERALRYAGVLTRGQYVIPGGNTRLDASGNVSAATSRQVLNALRDVRAAAVLPKLKNQRAVSSAGRGRRKGRKLANDLFVGVPVNGRGPNARPRPGEPEGIYRREGKRLRVMFVFTSQPPKYGRVLDFKGTVEAVARERFAIEFERAATALINRRRP
jgi:hypothetical protein